MLPKCYASIYQEANRKQENFFCVCVWVLFAKQQSQRVVKLVETQ